jgi:hypothetical protein
MPEFFALLGIDIFLAISLLTCLFDKHFPRMLPYLYQLAALVGFGHLLVSRGFLPIFEEYTRFWYSVIYLSIALTNIVAVNVYLAFSRKQYTLAKVFLSAVTIPVYLVSILFISSYTQLATYPVMAFPVLGMDTIFVAVVSLDTAVVSVGVYLFLRPKWWQITATATAIIASASLYAVFKPAWQSVTFLGFAMFLGVACIIVLGASIYILLRLWRETKNK